jgi:hypothetical protein
MCWSYQKLVVMWIIIFGIQAFCPASNLIPASDKKSVNGSYLMNDTVCCEVLEVNSDTEKLVCGMKGVTLPPNSEYSSRLGRIHSDDFPEVYKWVSLFEFLREVNYICICLWWWVTVILKSEIVGRLLFVATLFFLLAGYVICTCVYCALCLK